MAVKTILCPVVMSTRDTPRGRQNTGWRPSLHGPSMVLPGRSAGAAVIGRDPGTQHPFCLYSIWADEFTDIDQHPDAVDFGGVPQGRLSAYLSHLDAFAFDAYAKRVDIQAKALQIGLTRSLTGRSVGAVLREFLRHLEPVATDDMYERSVPSVRETITDDFNRAGPALGSGWAASLGDIWLINASTTARPDDFYAYTTVKRSEASVPNDQYVQGDTEVTTGGGDGCQGGIMCRCSTSTAFYFAKFGGANYLELAKDSPPSYIADASITLALDTMQTLKITATGTTIVVHAAGVQKISVTDSSHASGVPGLWAFTGLPETYSDYDNFECTDASGGVAVAFARRSRPFPFRPGGQRRR